jgi:exodeoxyribonuclease V gamma subunit
LRRFVAELVAKAQPEVRLLDAFRLEALLLALFHDDAFLAEPELGEVRRYLQGGGGGSGALELRRYQLAHQLALIFDEYTLSRPEMLEAWQKGRLTFEGEGEGGARAPEGFGDGASDSSAAASPSASPSASIEKWQARLWRALAGESGLIARRASDAGQKWPTLAGLFRSIDPRTLALPPSVHVFGLSYVARAFHQVLAVLARRTALSIYTLNPCMELWEEREGDEPPALTLWGRPGREHVRLLNELSECDFQPRFADPTEARDTLLTRLQRDILTREPRRSAPERPLAEGDESIQLLACPSVRREAEIIAAEIWRLLQLPHDPPLRWNEIAVVVPDGSERALYQTHLAAAFDEMHALPHSSIDLPLAGESRVPEAVELLLALPLGDLKRQELLRLMVHPQVICRFPEATRDEWLAWCDALGIVHGADHADHADTYIDRDLVNWDQGLKRLALGAFMTGRASEAEARRVELDGESYLPEELREGRIASASAFALLARSLIADARFARTARLPLAEWLRFFRRQLASYLGAPADEDARALDQVRAALAGLDDGVLALGDRPIAYRIACELFSAALGSLGASRGHYLADGVVVASFLPMRAIPFRVVFVAGLGEGQFPSGERPNPLDLRLAKRRPGDVTPREQDRYLFLETLLCARERIYLSYVDRAALTGDELAPSSVVVELARFLDQGYLAPGERRRLRRDFPLRRHQDAHTRAASPAARAEAQAAALGSALGDHLGPHHPLPEPAALVAALPPALGERIAARLELCPPPAPAPAPEKLTLSISALRRFLECPLQGAAGAILGLREDEDDDPTDQEDEAFATARLPLLVGLREVFERAIGERPGGLDALERHYDELRRRSELSGVMPIGPFGRAERAVHLRVLKGWLALFHEAVGATSPGNRVRRLRFGAADEHARELAPHPPIAIPVSLGARILTVELQGQTSPLVDAPGSFWLVQRKKDLLKDGKESLRGFLDHVVLASAGLSAERPYTAWVANVLPDGEPALANTRFSPIAPDRARAWLGERIGELLSGPHDYLLPCEAVFQHFADESRSVTAFIDELRAKEKSFFSSTYGPVPHPRSYRPPSEDRARELIARRFGLYRKASGK